MDHPSKVTEVHRLLVMLAETLAVQAARDAWAAADVDTAHSTEVDNAGT